ncbi:MAG: hypothetical protein ACD_5C00351G0004 [uncultured bacterium]|nr:MAG: hypothetical protein ACD_5C00351G0004 [uncultured bacterium]
MSTLKDKIKNLPHAPGVYIFYGENKELLYIGKATNLRSRVGSYFRGEHNRGDWIDRMISLIDDIAFQETDSVLEALILESNLIKKHQPKYNTLEKDDKSFSYFAITKEEFPRVLIFRRTDLDLEKKLLIKKSVSKKLKVEEMKLSAIHGPYTSKMQMQIALKIIRRIFPFHSLKQKSEKGCLDFQLGVCPGPYSGKISSDEYKKNIRGIKMILEGKKGSLIRMLNKEMESAAKKEEFEKAADKRNKIYALEHIRDVALMTREFEELQPVISDQSLAKDKLITSYPLPVTKFRIEAYDISNISGDHAVGSMVVFENGKPNKSEYRKFKIKTVVGSNDVGMMREVLTRRFNNDWSMPSLILLDGGQGHANMMSDLVFELGIDVLVVAVAKGATRKNLNFQFPISNKIPMSQFPKEIQAILEDKNLIKHIMDEAHRFAITYHRKIRSKNSVK